MTSPQQGAGSPEAWVRLSDQPLASCRIFELRQRRYRHVGRGRENDFFVIRAPDWVNVLALTTDRKLILVRQYRFGADDFSLEIPGGMIEQGEDPVAAALRELREETGFRAKQARLLATVHPNPAIQSNVCHLVLAEEAEGESPMSWDPDEELQVLLAEPDDVLRWAREGRITHALVLNALFHFEPFWRATGRGGAPAV